MGILAGCQKENPTTPSVNVTDQVIGKSSDYRLRFAIDWGTPDKPYITHCAGLGGNCLPDLTVTGHKLTAIDNVWPAILAGDNEQIKRAFEAEYETLSTILDPLELKGVIDGTHVATGNDHPDHNPYRYLVIMKSGSINSVYPLMKEP